MNLISFVAVCAGITASLTYSPLHAAKPPKYIKVKSCAVSPPPCYVTLRTAVDSGDPSSRQVEASAVSPTDRIRRGCYDGVGVYLAPCTSKKHIEVQIID